MDARSESTDRESFERLVRDYQSAVCGIAFSVIRDRARSEELAQEAFLVAWRYRERVPVVTAGWVCAIARNLARNAARRRTEVAMEREPESDSRDARDALIERETEARALAALAALPEQYREAVVLYYRGEQSMSAVAEALGVSETAARQRVHRGRERLRDALAPVATALGATKPGVAFTAAAVAAFTAGGAGRASADSLPARRATLPAIAPAFAAVLTSGAIIISFAAAFTSDAAYRIAEAKPSPPPVTARNADIRAIAARFPAAAATRAPAPRGFSTAIATPGLRSDVTIDLDFKQAPLVMMMHIFADQLDAPIWTDPTLDAPIDIQGKRLPVMDALDDVVEQAGAIRTEVAAIRLVTFGGRTDAAQLGGDPISLQLRDAPLHDVLSLIEARLHMPISRLAFPAPKPCTPGFVMVEGRPVRVTCPTPIVDPSPEVTIDVHDVPAGAALEQVLLQTGLGFELTTGFAITPDPTDD